MRDLARAVVIGGGVGGCSILYWLTRLGWEDVVLCESVQRGLRSGYFDQGKLMLSRERGLRHFQKLVYRLLAE